MGRQGRLGQKRSDGVNVMGMRGVGVGVAGKIRGNE